MERNRGRQQSEGLTIGQPFFFTLQDLSGIEM